MISAEDAATYDKMEVRRGLALGKEIERLERQAALDLRVLGKPTAAIP